MLKKATKQAVEVYDRRAAAVSSAVNLAAADRNAQAFRGLINAVGRRLVDRGEDRTDPVTAGRLNTPDWLYQSWL